MKWKDERPLTWNDLNWIQKSLLIIALVLSTGTVLGVGGFFVWLFNNPL
jgi:NhaP-type Na+/H+ or K+/H+ antiporter